MGIHICFPFGFTQVHPIINPYGHLQMCPTWVFPDFPIILPIWAFSYISHLGSPRFHPYGTHIGIYIYFTFMFARVLPIRKPYWRSHWFPIWVYQGWPHKLPIWALSHVSHLGFPRFSLILPIWAFSYISYLGSPRFAPYGTHIGIHIYFPFVFAQVFTHKKPIWAFTLVSHLGLPRLTP